MSMQLPRTYQYNRFTLLEAKKRNMFPFKPDHPGIGFLGDKGGGKSASMEYWAEQYLKREKNVLICDWWGSADLENAYWCIPDIVKIFSWRRVPGKHTNKLKGLFAYRYQLSWVLDATVEKIEDDKAIRISDGKNELVIRRIMKDYRAEVLLDGRKTHELIIKKTKENEDQLLLVYDVNPFRVDVPARNVGYPVLIIKPEATKLVPKEPLCVCGIPQFEHGDPEIPCQLGKTMPLIEPISDETPLTKILQKAKDEGRIVIFNRGFYRNQEHAYKKAAQMFDSLYYLMLQNELPYGTNVVMLTRELSNLAPKKLKNMVGTFETNTKRKLQQLAREERHASVTHLGDWQKESDVEGSISDLFAVFVLKRVMRKLLPPDLQEFYDWIENRRGMMIQNGRRRGLNQLPSLSRLKPWQAYMIFHDDSVQLVNTMLPSFHHKSDGNVWKILANVDLDLGRENPKSATKSVERSLEVLAKVQQDQKEEQAIDEAISIFDGGKSYSEIVEKEPYKSMFKESKNPPEALRKRLRDRRKVLELRRKARETQESLQN